MPPLVGKLTGEVDERILLRGLAAIIDQSESATPSIIAIRTSAKSPDPEQGNRALELPVFASPIACEFGFELQSHELFYLKRSREPEVEWPNSLRDGSDFVKHHGSVQHIVTIRKDAENYFTKKGVLR